MSVDSTTVEFFIDGAIRQASSVIKELMEPTLNDFEQAESDKFTVTIKITGMRKSQPGNHAMLCTPLVLGQQSGAAARPADEPCPTISTAGAVRVATPVIVDMSRPSWNDSGHVGSAEDPIRTITTFDNVQVAIPLIFDKAVGLPRLPDGRYLDIRIRMLKPSELAAAHSFPPDYVLTGNRGEQVKQIGNSVPVRTAAAMCQADLEEWAA